MGNLDDPNEVSQGILDQPVKIKIQYHETLNFILLTITIASKLNKLSLLLTSKINPTSPSASIFVTSREVISCSVNHLKSL